MELWRLQLVAFGRRRNMSSWQENRLHGWHDNAREKVHSQSKNQLVVLGMCWLYHGVMVTKISVLKNSMYSSGSRRRLPFRMSSRCS